MTTRPCQTGFALSALGLAALTAPVPAHAQTRYAVSDSQLQSSVSTALGNDPKLKDFVVKASASDGVVTLTGHVADENAREEAEQVVAGVSGVRSIQDNVDVGNAPSPADAQGAVAANLPPPPPDEPQPGAGAPQAAPPQTARGSMPPPPPPDAEEPQPPARQPYSRPPYPANGNQAGAYGYPAQPGYPPQPDYPAQPDYGPRGNAHPPRYATASPLGVPPQQQNASGPVMLPAGTLLSVRTTEPLSTGNLHGGEFFQVTAASSIYTSGVVAIPRGAVLTGQVVEAKNAGPLGGSPRLALRLTNIQLGGVTYPVTTDVWSNQGSSKSGYTATNTVGGAAIGALIGAVAGGGVGAGVGAIAGGATGVVVSGATHGPRLDLPPEALLQFHIEQPLTLQPVGYDEAARLAASAPQPPAPLQRRPVYYAPYPYVVRPYPYYPYHPY